VDRREIDLANLKAVKTIGLAAGPPCPRGRAGVPCLAESAPMAAPTTSPDRIAGEAPRPPVILTVDDEPAVLRAAARDLRRRFGRDFRVLRAESGPEALEVLDEIARRGDPVALIVADQRMPRMTGVEFLGAARSRFPDARKVLLTAYADTDAAIAAINELSLDFYLLKPWDPPEEKLYPIVAELLEDWSAEAVLAQPTVRLIGHRWSPDSHAAKDFLTRNQIPYRWVDVERDEESRRLLEAAGLSDPALPVLLTEDGVVLERPSNLELAGRFGLSTAASLPFYDLVIVGGGPAGLGAAVYGASEGLRTIMVEREAPGGQAGQSSRIENYLGFPAGLSGSELARRASAQARRFGAEILAVQEVAGVETRGPARVLRLTDGSELASHTVLVATGVEYRRLEAPGADELSGRGVYYGAAMTEGASCADQPVAIVGGANSAGQAAVYFSRHARGVVMLIRGASIEQGMSQYLVDQIARTANIEVRTRAEVARAEGAESLEAIVVRDRDSGDEERLPVAGMFIFIGAAPRTEWLDGVVARDERGFIFSGPDLLVDGRPPRGWPLERQPFMLETSAPGIFVAGDVRHRSVKRVASAVGEGAMAVQEIHGYLADR
jgi:thioredoxin reductase (NADPH)